MNLNVVYNNNNTNRHHIDIIRNNMETQLIITYNRQNKSEMQGLLHYLKENKFIFMYIDRKNNLIEFSVSRKHQKSNIYLIKEAVASQYFDEIDEIYLYITLVKSYKNSIAI